MNELRCPRCLAPAEASGGELRTCRFCGAALALNGGQVVASAAPATNVVFLDDCGHNKIEVIKVIRLHLKLGLREAKDLADRVPCSLGSLPDAARAAAFRGDLANAGARVR